MKTSEFGSPATGHGKAPCLIMTNLILLATFCTHVLLVHCHRRILMIGDSIDRLIMAEGCTRHHVERTAWGDQSINYGGNSKSKMPSGICELKYLDYSISSLHIFGSAGHGPYLWIDTAKDPFAASIPRIKKALMLYYEQVGTPTAVFFSTILWDIRPFWVYGGLNTTDPKFNETTVKMRSDVIERLNDIRQIIGPNIELGLRTSSYYNDNNVGYLMTAWNDVYREIAHELNVSLIDIDRDVWAITNYEYSFNEFLMRDGKNHPRTGCLEVVGEKIVGRRYTSSYIRKPPHPHSLDSCASAMGTGQVLPKHCWMDQNFTVKLIQGLQYKSWTQEHRRITTKGLFYLDRINGSLFRWNNITEIFLRNSLLGFGDVLHVPEEDFEAIPLVGSVPNHFFEHVHSALGVVTTGNDLYLVRSLVARAAPSPEAFAFYTRNVSVVRGVEPMWVRGLEPGAPLPHTLGNNTLIRFHSERQVYAVLDMVKRAIPNQDVFLRHGYDFGNVVVMKHKDMFDEIPTGPDLD